MLGSEAPSNLPSGDNSNQAKLRGNSAIFCQGEGVEVGVSVGNWVGEAGGGKVAAAFWVATNEGVTEERGRGLLVSVTSGWGTTSVALGSVGKQAANKSPEKIKQITQPVQTSIF